MATKMERMVKATTKKTSKKPPVSVKRQRAIAAPKQSPGSSMENEMGSIIGLGAKTIIGVGLLGGLGQAMNGMKIGGGNPPLPPP